MEKNSALLEISDLRVSVSEPVQRQLLDGISLLIAPGESVGLVGESGSGKSLTVKAITRLLGRGLTAEGQIAFDGDSVMGMSKRQLARYRSRDIGIIHQDPRSHIDPMGTIGEFLIEGVVSSGQMSKAEAEGLACQFLKDVGIKDAERRMRQYPHQLSGGMLQRVMIVAALLPNPRLVLADESTTALDVTVQSEVVAIMLEQIKERQLSLLFITHDLDLAAAVADRIVVMYAGRVAEVGTAEEVYSRPRHPYTAGLLASRPSTTEVRRLTTIPGRPIAAYEVGDGCSFAGRCGFAVDLCRTKKPELRTRENGAVACHRSEDIAAELRETTHVS